MVRGAALRRLSLGHPSEQQNAGRKKPWVPCGLSIKNWGRHLHKEILEWFNSFDLLDKGTDRQAASLPGLYKISHKSDQYYKQQKINAEDEDMNHYV